MLPICITETSYFSLSICLVSLRREFHLYLRLRRRGARINSNLAFSISPLFFFLLLRKRENIELVDEKNKLQRPIDSEKKSRSK